MLGFGVFDIINLTKAKRGRPKGKHATYVAEYGVTTRHGSYYEQRFYRGQEGKIGKWLTKQNAKGNSVTRLDLQLAPPPQLVIAQKPAPRVGWVGEKRIKDMPQHVVTHEQIAHERVSTDPGRIRFERLGDHLSKLDPTGYKQGKWLRETTGKIDKLREEVKTMTAAIAKISANKDLKDTLNEQLSEKVNKETELRSLLKQRDAVMMEFTHRPLSWKISRVQALRAEILATKKEARQWMADETKPEKQGKKDHPMSPAEIWAAELAMWKLGNRRAKKKGLKSKPAPMYPKQFAERLNELKWKLKGTLGKTVVVPSKGAKVPAGHSKVAATSASDEMYIGETDFLLTTGKWKNHGPTGVQFTPTQANNFAREFAPLIDKIVNGTMKGFHGSGGYKELIPGFKDIREDLVQIANVTLIKQAMSFDSEKASKYRKVGVTFAQFVRTHINHRIRDELTKYIADKKRLSSGEKDELMHVISFDDAHDFTSQQLRDSGAPMERKMASAEDILELQDTQRLLATKVSPLDSIAVMSRLNLVNTSDNPLGGGGLKSWDEVAEDIVRELPKVKGREGGQISPQFAKQYAIRAVASMFGGAKAKWLKGMTNADKEALRSGLKLMVKMVIGGSVVMPKTHDLSQVHRKVGPNSRLRSRFAGGYTWTRIPGSTGTPHLVYNELDRNPAGKMTFDPATGLRMKKSFKISLDSEIRALLAKLQKLARRKAAA